MSSTTSVAQQTEGQTVSNTTPATALVGAQIETVAGQVTICPQVSDRGFTGGGPFVIVISRQLQQQLDEKVNLYALNQALAGAASVAGQSSFTNAGLYQDLASARETLIDTAGTSEKIREDLRMLCAAPAADRRLGGIDPRAAATAATATALG